MIEEFLPKLLEQGALVVIVIVGAYLMYKDRNKFIAAADKERKAYKKELKELNETRAKELRDVGKEMRQIHKETMEALDKLTDTLNDIK